MSNISPITAKLLPPPMPVQCECGRTVFDGLVITTRVVRVFPVAEAKCRCKRWVRVPVAYSQE